MNKQLGQVKEFHKLFNHPVLDYPQIPSNERCQLRISLLKEEVEEFEKGISDKDIVEIADSLSDIAYVLYGAILEFGLGDKFNDLFNEVQRSNMSKACSSHKETVDTIAFYESKNIESYYKEVDGKFLIFRKSDNKVLKSINYSPANLKNILNDE